VARLVRELASTTWPPSSASGSLPSPSAWCCWRGLRPSPRRHGPRSPAPIARAATSCRAPTGPLPARRRPGTLVERWDGARWSTVASPNPDPGGLNELNGVASVPSGPGTVWAVGSHSTPNASFGTRNLILRRTGGGRQVLPSPAFTPEDDLEVVDATGPPTRGRWAGGAPACRPQAVRRRRHRPGHRLGRRVPLRPAPGRQPDLHHPHHQRLKSAAPLNPRPG
jgi:hypothetical protein